MKSNNLSDGENEEDILEGESTAEEDNNTLSSSKISSKMSPSRGILKKRKQVEEDSQEPCCSKSLVSEDTLHSRGSKTDHSSLVNTTSHDVSKKQKTVAFLKNNNLSLADGKSDLTIPVSPLRNRRGAIEEFLGTSGGFLNGRFFRLARAQNEQTSRTSSSAPYYSGGCAAQQYTHTQCGVSTVVNHTANATASSTVSARMFG